MNKTFNIDLKVMDSNSRTIQYVITNRWTSRTQGKRISPRWICYGWRSKGNHSGK